MMNINSEVAIGALLNTLKEKEWKIVLKNKRRLSLAESFNIRYPQIPEDYLLFLSLVESCCDPAGKLWFLTENEYNGKGSAPIVWNLFETLSLEGRIEYGYDDDVIVVREFWDSYIPILVSAGAEYIYIAIGVRPENWGQIIWGLEPEFEESAQEICGSFTEFCELYSKAQKAS